MNQRGGMATIALLIAAVLGVSYLPRKAAESSGTQGAQTTATLLSAQREASHARVVLSRRRTGTCKGQIDNQPHPEFFHRHCAQPGADLPATCVRSSYRVDPAGGPGCELHLRRVMVSVEPLGQVLRVAVGRGTGSQARGGVAGAA